MSYYVYILVNSSGTLYTGVTNNLERRMFEHKNEPTGFTRKYRVSRLLYYEAVDEITSAIAREKEIKGWRRDKKLHLIESINPAWADLSESWFRER
jgi:putative endonuclease